MPNTYFESKKLLEAPVERAAFSDRMAYVCAELSKLAYFKFEGGHLLDQAKEMIDFFVKDEGSAKELKSSLALIISQMPGTEEQSEQVLQKILDAAGFNLEKTFFESGTQAFLCTRNVAKTDGGSKKVAYLAFRGTEPTAFEDIKSDVRAALKPVTVGKETIEIHTGYYEAFQLVEKDIDATLQALKYDQLFVTGHSLGGALAMVATRLLPYEIRGACYTFGAPPVSTLDFQNGLKTPVYEIINEADIVPALPNPWAAWGIIMFLHFVKFLTRFCTVINKTVFGGSWDESFVKHMKTMTRYEHPGYLSYLHGSENNARLRYQVSFYRRSQLRITLLWKLKWSGFKKMGSDHSIDLYVAKLRSHGDRRN